MKRLFCVILIAVLQLLPAMPALAVNVEFVRDVRPILQKHCYPCHGAEKQKSNLRLDIKSEGIKGGETYGPSFVTGNADESPLIRFVRDDDPELRMPLDGKPLTAEEISTLTKWVEQGAIWPDGADLVQLDDKRDHWSFKPLMRPDPPAILDSEWARNDIDHFVLSRLEQAGLHTAPQADRVTWLRRVSFDLIGLLPSPENADAFVHDGRDDAYERIVEELLDLAALRRALGPALAGCRPFRRNARLRGEHRAPQRVAVSRLRHRGVQQRHAVRPLHPRATRR